MSAARKNHSWSFSLSRHKLKTYTSDKQCQGLKHQKTESDLLVTTLDSILCSTRGVLQFLQKEYIGILPRHRRMDIADTCVLCSAATSHSNLQTEQESWILWNLHFNSYRTQKVSRATAKQDDTLKTRRRWGREYVKGVWWNWWEAENIWGNKLHMFLL